MVKIHFKLDKEKAKDVAKRCIGVVVSALIFDFCSKFNNSPVYNYCNCNYCADKASAIKAIMNSNMSDYFKKEAINNVRDNMKSDYYDSIITVALDSRMSGYYKSESIKNLV